jgi:hypothetical protein
VLFFDVLLYRHVWFLHDRARLHAQLISQPFPLLVMRIGAIMAVTFCFSPSSFMKSKHGSELGWKVWVVSGFILSLFLS